MRRYEKREFLKYTDFVYNNNNWNKYLEDMKFENINSFIWEKGYKIKQVMRAMYMPKKYKTLQERFWEV